MDEKSVKDKQDEIYNALEEVAQKYGIKNYAFEGSINHEGKIIFIGWMRPEDKTTTSLMDSFSNAGRLWQHCREVFRGFMDSFEK